MLLVLQKLSCFWGGGLHRPRDLRSILRRYLDSGPIDLSLRPKRKRLGLPQLLARQFPEVILQTGVSHKKGGDVDVEIHADERDERHGGNCKSQSHLRPMVRLSSCRLCPDGRSGLGRSYRERALHWIPVRRRDPARLVVLTDPFTRLR